jgi:hypothetical protein
VPPTAIELPHTAIALGTPHDLVRHTRIHYTTITEKARLRRPSWPSSCSAATASSTASSPRSVVVPPTAIEVAHRYCPGTPRDFLRHTKIHLDIIRAFLSGQVRAVLRPRPRRLQAPGRWRCPPPLSNSHTPLLPLARHMTRIHYTTITEKARLRRPSWPSSCSAATASSPTSSPRSVVVTHTAIEVAHRFCPWHTT